MVSLYEINVMGQSIKSSIFGANRTSLRQRIARFTQKREAQDQSTLLRLDSPVEQIPFVSQRKKRQDSPLLATAPTPASSSAQTNQIRDIGHQSESVKHDTTATEHTTKAMSDHNLEIYTEHFGLKSRPFTLVPDPEFIYWSPGHRRAYTMLEYGLLTRAPITLITGEIGSGKTTLLRHLLNTLDGNTRIGLVSNAQGSRSELLRWVLMSLGQTADPEATYVDLFEIFQNYLIQEYALGNRVVVIFDEAQNLSRKSLEELRMFTNINSSKDELLLLVLVGQPELRDMISKPSLRQLAQRIASSFHLGAMDAETVHAYIGHRLLTAGAPRNLFHRTACDLIYKNTGGVPRLVNQLCDLAMVYAFTANQKTVTERTVQNVLDEGTFFGAGTVDVTEDTE